MWLKPKDENALGEILKKLNEGSDRGKMFRWKLGHYACFMLTGRLTKWATPCQVCSCQAQAETEEGLDLALLHADYFDLKRHTLCMLHAQTHMDAPIPCMHKHPGHSTNH